METARQVADGVRGAAGQEEESVLLQPNHAEASPTVQFLAVEELHPAGFVGFFPRHQGRWHNDAGSAAVADVERLFEVDLAVLFRGQLVVARRQMMIAAGFNLFIDPVAAHGQTHVRVVTGHDDVAESERIEQANNEQQALAQKRGKPAMRRSRRRALPGSNAKEPVHSIRAAEPAPTAM